MKTEPDLIVRSGAPRALEFPFETLVEPITPNDLFFVRNHFDTPSVVASTWRMRVEGRVERPIELSLDEVRALPKVSVETVLECAGNGRAALETPVSGLQWDRGAVGNAVWSGATVRSVLELAGVMEALVDVVFEGADKGTVKNPPVPRGEISYSRSLPREIALSDGAILAYEMNGEPLPPDHGYPVRLVVPGWYGAASVKWVVRILALDHAFQGYFQTSDYSYWQLESGIPQLRAIGPIPIKSTIARPAPGTSVRIGDTFDVCGAAWTGVGDIAAVEVSVDGGCTWQPADLAPATADRAWRLWSLPWRVEGPTGTRTVIARAFDSRGNVQAAERNWNYGSYVIDHSIPLNVTVSDA